MFWLWLGRLRRWKENVDLVDLVDKADLEEGSGHPFGGGLVAQQPAVFDRGPVHLWSCADEMAGKLTHEPAIHTQFKSKTRRPVNPGAAFDDLRDAASAPR